jgi:hypothetical protein
MARSSVRTIIPLDRWAQLVGINPVHFNQIQVAGMRTCDESIYQWPWQDAGRISREDIASALKRAEDAVAGILGYDIGPRWHTDELVSLNQWSWSGKLRYGHVLGGGVETLSLVGADVPITWDSRFSTPLGVATSDQPSLTYQDKATIQVTTSVTDPNEIALFYPASVLEALGVSGGDYTWQIRPINVSISGGVATITCNRHQLVLPELLEEWVPGQLDGLNDDHFVGLVDVYRHYNDPSSQVEFRYRSCCCGGSFCGEEVCTYGTQTGCLLPYQSKFGYVSLTPSTWNGNQHIYDLADFGGFPCAYPEGAMIQYKAGLDPIDPELERIVANLALSYLPTNLCSCSGINARYDDLISDYVASRNGSLTGPTGFGLDPTPLGTTKAAFEAFAVVGNRRLGRSSGNA